MLSYYYLSNLVVIRPCHASTSSMEASTSRPSFENNDQWPKFGNSHCIQLCNLELIQAWKVGRIRACENRMEKGQMNFSWQSETLKGWICSVPAHLPQRTATHGVLLTSVDICWHLLTSVDICWHLLTSVDHTDVVRITNVLRRSLLVSSVPLSSYSGIRAGRRFASLARPNSTWFDRDIRDRNASWHRSWDPNCVQGPRWRPSYRNAR